MGLASPPTRCAGARLAKPAESHPLKDSLRSLANQRARRKVTLPIIDRTRHRPAQAAIIAAIGTLVPL